MKFGFKIRQLMGSSYGHGQAGKETAAPNILFTSDGNSLLSPIGNRINVIDLENHKTRVLTPQHRKNIRIIALSKDSRMLLSVDVEGRALFINMIRGVPLHRMNFRGKVRSAEFSPNDKYIAVSVGKRIDIWQTPAFFVEFAPLARVKQLSGFGNDITCLSWAGDSDHLIAGSKDLTAKLFRLKPLGYYTPPTFSGHRAPVVGCFIVDDVLPSQILSIAKDGAIFFWKLQCEGTITNPESCDDNAVFQPGERSCWRMDKKDFLKPSPASFSKIKSVCFHRGLKILVAGFDIGVFGIWDLASFSVIHTLSVGGQPLKTVTINSTGDWLAIGSSHLGQLLVWEWRAESYVIKQQGHNYGLSCLDFSPNGQLIVTGGDDNKVKVWNTSSGFCYLTFSEHISPITAVVFSQSGQVIISSSLDGTVRCHDLVRYKCFRTLTAPQAVQLVSLAVDFSGDVICAGSLDPPAIYVWSLQSGKLLDVLTGHEGPISALCFNPVQHQLLASSSWDGDVKLWDVFKSIETETLKHEYDVLAVAFRPDGRQLCSTCMNGNLYFWDLENANVEVMIEGRRDISGGRKDTQLTTASSSASSKYFTSVCYSADGSCIIAGGESKFVCIYEISQKVLVKKFQLSINRSFDGVLDELNSRELTDAGPLSMVDVSESDSDAHENESSLLPGVSRGESTLNRKIKPAIRSSCVRFSPTGREWATTCTDGLLLFSLDNNAVFDPFELQEDATPAAVKQHIKTGEFTKAIVMSFHINEMELMVEALDSVQKQDIMSVTRSLSAMYLKQLFLVLTKRIESSAHIEYYLVWVQAILTCHGNHLKSNKAHFLSAFRGMQKAILKHQDNLFRICDENQYMLSFMEKQPR